LTARALQSHESKCRLARLKSGARFKITLNTRVLKVELLCQSPLGGWKSS
jgi:hypothetical protein